jgi:tetratricopeptide (TPR) repeat protein
MAMGRGDSARAIELLEQCRAQFEAEGDELRVIWTLTDLGIAYHYADDVPRARAAMAEALERARSIGYARGAAVLAINLGNLALQAGDVERAATLFEEAREGMRAAGDEQSEGNATTNLATANLARGDVDRAAELLSEAIALSRKTDDRTIYAGQLVVAAAILRLRGDLARAAEALAASASLQEEMDFHLDVVEARLWEQILPDLRSRLGEAEFEAAWAEGRSRDYAAALDEAVAAL